MLKGFGFVSRRAVKRPLLTVQHKQVRREFAAKFWRWSAQSWKYIIFSDEKIFRVRPGGLVRYWKASSVSKFSPRYVLPQVQKAEGLMVWAAMNGNGQICLGRCPPKVKAVDYQALPLGRAPGSICGSHPCPSAEALRIYALTPVRFEAG